MYTFLPQDETDLVASDYPDMATKYSHVLNVKRCQSMKSFFIHEGFACIGSDDNYTFNVVNENGSRENMLPAGHDTYKTTTSTLLSIIINDGNGSVVPVSYTHLRAHET